MGMPTINCLFLINSLRPGGAERAMSIQSRALNDLGPTVWFGTVYGEAQDQFFKPAVPCIHFQFQSLLDWRAWLEFRRFLKAQKITHIYATLDHASLIARLAKLLLLSRVRVFIRESGMPERKSYKLKILDKLLAAWTDRFVAVSEEVANQLRMQYPSLKHKIVTIENGVIIPPRVCLSRPTTSNQVTILNVGSFTENKGQREILEVFARLCRRPELPPLYLVFVGDGPRRGLLSKLVVELNTVNRVRFTGRLDTEALEKEYQAADIFILNSQTEGFPNVVLEAMAWSLPIVSSAVGGISRAVIPEETGLVFPVGDLDKMEKNLYDLIASSNKRLRLGQTGRGWATAEFSVEGTAKKLQNLLTQ
jgi:glycosyltransferase involved in cell wall biosynthesis